MSQALLRSQPVAHTLMSGVFQEAAVGTGGSSMSSEVAAQPPRRVDAKPPFYEPSFGSFGSSLLGNMSHQDAKSSNVADVIERRSTVCTSMEILGKTELNIEQRMAISAMLTGAGHVSEAPPFVLFGPPGK